MKEVAKRQKYTTSFLERGSFWFYGVGMIFYYMIVGSFMNTYLLMQGIDLGKIALILLLVKIWDAVNDPLFAYIFDRIKFKKEKCLPWLRIAALLMPLACVGFFSMPNGMSEAGKLIWFTIFYVLWDAAYTICDVPFFSMTTTMTANIDERNSLFSIARVFHGGGTLICTTMMTWFVGENCGMGFGKAALITCLVGVVFTIPLFIFGKERYAVLPEEKEEHPCTFKEMFRYLKQNKYLILIYGCQLLANGLNVTGAAGMLGNYYLYGQTSFGIAVTWINMIPGPVLGMLIPLVLKKVDRFKLYMGCNIFCFVCTLVNFAAYFMGWLTVPWAIMIAAVTAVPMTTAGILALMFSIDALEYGRYKTGINAVGINFAVQTFASKMQTAIASALGIWLLSLTSFVVVEANSIADLAGVVQTEQAITEMWLATQLPNLIGSGIAWTLLLCFYKLRSKDVELMAKYNAGEITREECDAQLSRKY